MKNGRWKSGEERSFLERAHTRREGEVEATVAEPGDRENERRMEVAPMYAFTSLGRQI
jgi:hypothetical protein